MLAAIAAALLLWVGTGGALAAWGISLGTLTAFLILFQQFFTPVTALGDEWQTVQSALSGAERIFQTLGLTADEPPPGGLAANGPVAAQPIALDDVVFGYVEARPGLRGVSLAVGPGEHGA